MPSFPFVLIQRKFLTEDNEANEGDQKPDRFRRETKPSLPSFPFVFGVGEAQQIKIENLLPEERALVEELTKI